MVRSWGFSLVAALVLAVPLASQHAFGDSHHSVSGAAADDAPPLPALERQLEELRRATEKYRDIEVARADGYVRFGSAEDPLMGEHWYRKDLVDQPLDLTRPSTLQYAVVDGERVLVGVAFTTYQRPGEPLPEGFAGELDRWHVHDIPGLARMAVENRPLLRALVERWIDQGKVGRPGGRTDLVMVHAWPWLENPDGPFAETHRALPYLRAGLPTELAASGDLDAARGIALLTANACPTELARLDLHASLDRDQAGALRAACRAAAAAVRTVDRSDPIGLNTAAAAAWREYSAFRDDLLSPEQHERIARAMEHPM